MAAYAVKLNLDIANKLLYNCTNQGIPSHRRWTECILRFAMMTGMTWMY